MSILSITLIFSYYYLRKKKYFPLFYKLELNLLTLGAHTGAPLTVEIKIQWESYLTKSSKVAS